MKSKGGSHDYTVLILLVTLIFGLALGYFIPTAAQYFKDSYSSKHTHAKGVQREVTQESEVAQPASTNALVIPGACVYFIQKGDTLTKIAERTSDTVQAIAKRNRIKNVNHVLAGQGIKIKESGGSCVVVSKTSSKKFTGHAGASQNTLFTKLHSQDFNLPKNCKLAGSRMRNSTDRLMARAECIRTHYGSMIVDAIAADGNLFSELEILAIMLQESQGDPRAVSNARVPCLGLMQLQPPTARQYGVEDIFDPRQNIFGGVRVFTDYVYRYGKGDKSYGLAAYNMGPEGLRKSRLNPERMKYVREVKAILRTLEEHQFTL